MYLKKVIHKAAVKIKMHLDLNGFFPMIVQRSKISVNRFAKWMMYFLSQGFLSRNFQMIPIRREHILGFFYPMSALYVQKYKITNTGRL